MAKLSSTLKMEWTYQSVSQSQQQVDEVVFVT